MGAEIALNVERACMPAIRLPWTEIIRILKLVAELAGTLVKTTFTVGILGSFWEQS